MPFLTQELIQLIETIYRFVKFLARFPLARKFLISNKYEYGHTVLDPLAMTKVEKGILGFPKLPKENELPDEQWLSLLLGVISVLTKKEKIYNLSNESVSNDHEINSLESINTQIKAAKGKKDLTNAVLNLKSALRIGNCDEQLEVRPKNVTDIQLESAFSEFENNLDKIDREIEACVSKFSQSGLVISFSTNEIEQPDEELYRNLEEIARFLGRELIKKQTVSTESLRSATPNPTLQDYEKLIDPLKVKPATLTNFQQDDVFAYMQVAGSNPVMLKQIKEIDSRLPISKEKYQKIVPQDSLEAALQEGRLYLADYSKLEKLENGSFGGQKYIYAPVALFAVPPDNSQDQNLLPIAIRCQQTPGDENPIFTPLDGENWMTAKTVLQMADSNYHELISHLAQTHLFIEPFVLATNRCFQPDHFVRLLLKPHLEGTILINYGAYTTLLAPEGSIDSLLSGTLKSNSQLVIDETLRHLANFNDVAFPRTLEKRGVNNSKQLPIYPYRDDGQRVWDAIHQWVEDYLGLFYRNQSVETDEQLQDWAQELFYKGHCHIGEKGDGRIKSLTYLVDAISTIIFTASVQHAAVNFPQSGLMSYAPAFPLGCYSPAPTKPQQPQNFMGLLPSLKQAQLQIQVLYLLGSVYYTKLGDYSDSFLQNEKVKIAFDKFKVNLDDIEKEILIEDSQRLVSYRYLLPSKIPQSINI
ncbi:MAG: lipoxygenase [Nodularia sp. (in: Bacteria)]|nr:MAG: lipoxygenase [Nodularia sp. (in: cyanobacteria)]